MQIIGKQGSNNQRKKKRQQMKIYQFLFHNKEKFGTDSC